MLNPNLLFQALAVHFGAEMEASAFKTRAQRAERHAHFFQLSGGDILTYLLQISGGIR